MATYEEAFAEFTKEMDNMGISYHEELFHAVTKYLGPSIHNRDASLVACSDKAELAHIKEKFLIGKLGLEDSPRLDRAILEVCGHLGHSNRKKHRSTFYYLLVAILGEEAHFLGKE
jgi:hypothetical protein